MVVREEKRILHRPPCVTKTIRFDFSEESRQGVSDAAGAYGAQNVI